MRACGAPEGGRLVLAPFARDREGRYFGRTRGVNVFETVNDIGRAFVDDCAVTHEEYSRMNHVQYYRSEEEWRAPFGDPSGAVSRPAPAAPQNRLLLGEKPGSVRSVDGTVPYRGEASIAYLDFDLCRAAGAIEGPADDFVFDVLRWIPIQR